MKKYSTMAVLLAVALPLSACGGYEDDSNETNGDVTTKETNIEEKETPQKDDPAPKSNVTKEDYQTIKETFSTYDLQDQTRLSQERAEGYFPDDVEISDDNIYFANLFAFDKETQTAISTRWDAFDGLQTEDTSTALAPNGSHVLGTFKKEIDDVFKPFLKNGYDYESAVDHVETLADTNGSQIEILQISLSETIYRIDRLQPFIKDEHEALKKWAAETKTLFEEADNLLEEGNLDTFMYVVAGLENLENFIEVVEESEKELEPAEESEDIVGPSSKG